MRLRIPQPPDHARHGPSRPAVPTRGVPLAAVHSARLPPLAADFGRIAVDVSRATPTGPCIQPKLAVSGPEDAEEREADRIADEVAATPAVTLASPDGGDGEPPSAPGGDTPAPDEPDAIQRSAVGGSAPEAGEDLQARLDSRRGQGAALPASVPIEAPIAASTMASSRNWTRIWPSSAPIAFLRPIS